MPANIKIGKSLISDDSAPIFFPDIDVYFKGDVEKAYSLLDRLAECGAPIVKGALIHSADLCYRDSRLVSYHVPGKGMVQESYYGVLERHVLPLNKAEKIYNRAAKLGLDVVFTVYDEDGIAFAIHQGAAALKIASSNITHAALIQRIAKLGLPVVMDTGRSTWAEIARAVDWARQAGAEHIVIQHSPPAPPVSANQAQLNMMPAMGSAFNCHHGLSDHHIGTEMMLAAVVLGAKIIEKGICPDDAADDIDLAHAARISAVPDILKAILIVWESLGNGYRILPENRPRPPDRMSLIMKDTMTAGSRIVESDLTFQLAAPLDSIGAEYWHDVLNRKLRTTVMNGSALRWSDLDIS